MTEPKVTPQFDNLANADLTSLETLAAQAELEDEMRNRFVAGLSPRDALESDYFAMWKQARQARETACQAQLDLQNQELEEFHGLLRTYTQLPSELSAEPPSWLLDEFIGESVLTLIHGTQGHGKSMLALWIAKAIATGSELLGRKGTGYGRPVIFVDKENPQSIVRKRLEAIGALDLKNLFYWGEWRYPNRPPNSFGNKTLDDLADLGRPFFIFDSLSSFEEGLDENLPAQMQVVMQKAHLLAFHSAGVLVLHHDNKDGSFRGATPITAVPEMAIHLYQNENTRHITLSETKFRMCGGWKMTLKMPFEPAACEIISDTAGKGVTPEETAVSKDLKIALVQTALNVDPNLSAARLEKLTGVPDTTLGRWLKTGTVVREFRLLKI